MKTKIKGQDGFWLLTSTLVLSLLFFIVQLIIQENKQGSLIVFEKLETDQIIKANNYENSDFQTVVASKTGKFYYYPSCGRVQLIKDSNKIWFKSVQLAKQSGYLPADGCLPQK